MPVVITEPGTTLYCFILPVLCTVKRALVRLRVVPPVPAVVLLEACTQSPAAAVT
jgi:hypothetical protein